MDFGKDLIRLTKSALKGVLGHTHATLESLQTLVTEVEAILNNCRLTYNSPDMDDPCPVTPDYKEELRLSHFWSRWSKESALDEFHCTTGNNVQTAKVGDTVQIHDDCLRIQWRLGVTDQLNQGADGLVRSVQLRTSTGRTNFPLVKLYPVEVAAKAEGEGVDTNITCPPPSLPRGCQRLMEYIN